MRTQRGDSNPKRRLRALMNKYRPAGYVVNEEVLTFVGRRRRVAGAVSGPTKSKELSGATGLSLIHHRSAADQPSTTARANCSATAAISSRSRSRASRSLGSDDDASHAPAT